MEKVHLVHASYVLPLSQKGPVALSLLNFAAARLQSLPVINILPSR